jgi:hypothetical protein
MSPHPITILYALMGGLVLAGLLGWIRKPRLVVHVPRLFSHSKISDQGQIVEISIMNLGFKTEESVELSLNPALKYELVGSNNPDVTMAANKLAVPRIGSSDDCSVLLQVEKGVFSAADVVTCLSKETKAVVTTKLEEIPATAQQRVGIVAFLAFFVLLGFVFFKGLDYFVGEDPPDSPSKEPRADSVEVEKGAQGWVVSDIYWKGELFEKFREEQIALIVGEPKTGRTTIEVPIQLKNKSNEPISLTIWISGAVSQDDIALEKRRISDQLVFPKDELDLKLTAAIPREEEKRAVIVEFMLESGDGSTLIGRRLISAK